MNYVCKRLRKALLYLKVMIIFANKTEVGFNEVGKLLGAVSYLSANVYNCRIYACSRSPIHNVRALHVNC